MYNKNYISQQQDPFRIEGQWNGLTSLLKSTPENNTSIVENSLELPSAQKNSSWNSKKQQTKLAILEKRLQSPTPLTQLLQQPKHRAEKINSLKFIDALYKGVDALKPYLDYLIVRKRDEEPELLQRRKDIFVYHNYIESSIRELISKFNTGNYTLISSKSPAQEIYSSLDAIIKGKELINLALKTALRLGTTYVVVEPNYNVSIAPQTIAQRNYSENKLAAQLKQAVMLKKPMNFLTVYTPFNCIVEDESYYKFSVSQGNYDIDESFYFTTELRYITPNYFISFTYDTKETANHRWLYRADFTQEWTTAKDLKIAPKVIKNPTGILPVYKLALQEDEWVANQLKDLQVEETRIRNSMVANAYAAGHIQPWTTPLENNSGLPGELTGEIKTGSAYVIEAKNFEFAETTGKSVEYQLKVINDIKTAIKQTVGLSNLSFDDAKEMSGRAKEFEIAQLNDTMRLYGLKVTEFYQSILRHIGIQLGETNGDVQVEGYDDFSLDSASITLEHFKQMSDAKITLPPLAEIALKKKLVTQLFSNADEDFIAAVEKELKKQKYSVSEEEK